LWYAEKIKNLTLQMMTQLSTKELTLRPFRSEDRDRLALLCNNKKIWDNVRDFLPHPYTEKDASEFICLCLMETPQTTFAVEYCGELAGCIGLVLQTDIYRLGAELGYWFGEPYWGKGIATRAVGLISEYGFQQLGLERIYSGVFSFNVASQRVLEKAGFQREGIFKRSILKNGKICDDYRYAKLKPLGEAK